ncbi:MarR family transcriptional regulator [Paenibacillus tepidiphilus]|uniref:LexA family protein n=1 Tax=Paenibacillus tepidiphilus TaxID=2608683 RepID=UPI00123A8745|nr:MarR family transcriptional regulator [Paenibacillus tepidiphilus]
MMDLTKREQEALEAILVLFDRLKYSPTVREIGEEMGLASTSTTFRYIERLEAKGYIERRESSPRALRVLRRA